MTTARKRPQQLDEPLIMHGAKLPASVVEKVGILHAKTRKTKRQLHAEAYAFLLAHYEEEGVLQPTAAELAERTLKAQGGNA